MLARTISTSCSISFPMIYDRGVGSFTRLTGKEFELEEDYELERLRNKDFSGQAIDWRKGPNKRKAATLRKQKARKRRQ